MDAPEGYVWSGKLGQTDIGTLYARCQTLRFTGRLELQDGMNRAEVHFLAGEPAEIEGGDTQQIALWMRGSFRAVQAIPDLTGKLTRQLELAGSINDAKPSALFAWIGQNRLSCDLQIHQLTSVADVQFVNGRAERVRMDGLEDLAALAKISAWNEGTFRVKLLPLFISEASSPGHPIEPRLEKMPPVDSKQFDLTNSIRVSAPKPPPLPPLPAPPRRNSSSAMPAVTESFGSGPAPSAQPDETALIRSTHRGAPAAAVTELPENINLKPKSNLTIWIITGTAMAGAGILLWLVLKNNGSPIATRPVDQPTTAARPAPVAKTPLVPAEATPVRAAPDDEKVARELMAAGAPPTAATPDAGAIAAAKPAEKAPSKTEPEPAKLVEPANAPPADEIAAVQLLPARKALIEGNARKAIATLEQLKKRHPQSTKLASLLDQAKGKLGKAEIVLDGRGIVTIDGHKFHAPKKFHVMAGPHLVLQDGAANEFVLRKGEKRRFKVSK